MQRTLPLFSLPTFFFLLAALLLPILGTAQETTHIRFVSGDGQWQGDLQTAVTLLRNKAGQRVHLISAVHIGDTEYYDELNNYFADLDELLFELVADASDIQRSSIAPQSVSPLSLIQNLLANYLQLEFQLSAIDYDADNFRHADLSVAELRDIMSAKDETFFTMFLTMAAAQMSAERQGIIDNSIQPTALTVVSLMDALSSDNQSQALKFLLAEELARSGGLSLDAEVESGLTILGDRNKAALAVLEDSLSEGYQEIGLFYGAAHMSGLMRVLVNEMGFKQESQQWLTAWAIP